MTADRAAVPAVRRRLAPVVVGTAVLAAAVLAAAGAALAIHAAGGPGHPGGSGQYQTSAVTVTRQSLTSQTQVDATLGYAGSYSVVVPPSGSSPGSSPGSGSSTGTFTWLPAAGQTVRQGQPVYQVSGSPVVLLYGQVPAYRTLSEGMTGADVTQLNHDLVRLGYASQAQITGLGWDYFSWGTSHALQLLQSHLGITDPSGLLVLGTAVFLPGPALITGLGSSAVLGGQASSGAVVATASSTTPVVTIDLDASLQSDVKDGDPVSITLPSGTATPGVISQVDPVASSPSNNTGDSGPGGSGGSGPGSPATITVLASMDHPKAAGNLNQAPVTVTITTGSVPDALVVPVAALLAEPGGGYTVEVTGPGGHRLVPVTLGLFDDQAGLVQVTGKLTPGQRIVGPAS
jgi:hypothetical protein